MKSVRYVPLPSKLATHSHVVRVYIFEKQTINQPKYVTL